MKDRYSMDNLEKTFTEHSRIGVECLKKRIEEYKIKYPDQPLPSALKEDFSLSLALLAIVKEIKWLTEWIGRIDDPNDD